MSHSHDHTEEDKKKALKKTRLGVWITIPLLIAALLLFKWLFFSGSSNSSDKDDRKKDQTEKVSLKGTVTKIETINFTGKYDEIYYVPYGFNFSFMGASTDYCMTTKDGAEYCGKKNQDISNQLMEKSEDNTELQFKSKNGKDGTIQIYLVSRN